MLVPFPDFEENVCSLLSCSSQKIKTSVCGMLTKRLFCMDQYSSFVCLSRKWLLFIVELFLKFCCFETMRRKEVSANMQQVFV